MSGDEGEEQMEVVPKVGDEFLAAAEEEGEGFTTQRITEVFDLDEDSGLYKVSGDDGQEYHIYWSEEENTWVHSEE